MADAKLKYDGNEITLGQGITTLGRTTDNTVAFPSDSNISRFHAEIEWRDGDFWLIDLNSSNGTKLNGETVKSDKRLADGDEITLGGSSQATFSNSDQSKQSETPAAGRREEPAVAADVENTGETAETAAGNEEYAVVADEKPVPKSRMPLMLGLAGATVGLAAICVVGAVVYSYSGTAKCAAKVVITKPENGETITQKTEIETESENAECVERAIFLINGREFADATEQPFTATLDPAQFPELANGSLQNVQIVLEDAKGEKIVQPGEIALQFDTIEVTPPPVEVVENTTPTPTPAKTGTKVSGGDVQDMSKNLIKEFSGAFNYKFDPQFLSEVQKKTADYAADGYFARAAVYKDIISVSFVQERNLDAPLGFILAMSRSQFKLGKTGADEGLWQMNPTFAGEIGATGSCGTETLSDPAQNCASKAASLYLKSLVLEVFEGDVVYSVAAFGKSPQEANIWKSSLPADPSARADFWKIIKDPKQRENVVKFFAAGIVAENPQKFGLKKDRPISELYKTLVGS
ncbi:MAG: FHA domain-containing protein [Acidobacteriota bacterium]|nr:FHA domain-containing protein [Acidobacteriota bacterium]